MTGLVSETQLIPSCPVQLSDLHPTPTSSTSSSPSPVSSQTVARPPLRPFRSAHSSSPHSTWPPPLHCRSTPPNCCLKVSLKARRQIEAAVALVVVHEGTSWTGGMSRMDRRAATGLGPGWASRWIRGLARPVRDLSLILIEPGRFDLLSLRKRRQRTAQRQLAACS